MRTNRAPCVINTVQKMLATGWMICGSNPVAARFSAPVQTGSGAHPAPGTIGTETRPGRDLGHHPLSSSEVKERVELYLYSPSGPSWPVLGRIFPYLNNLEKTRSSNWKIFFTVSGLYLDNEIVTSTNYYDIGINFLTPVGYFRYRQVQHRFVKISTAALE